MINVKLKPECQKAYDAIVGRNKRLVDEKNRAVQIGATNNSVLIRGENGTGKELIARLIHKASDRSDNIFHKVNCPAIAETLFESEVFGHIKGSFTDSIRDRVGAFLFADKGTIFLDEIGDLSLNLQSKLLQVLEGGVFTPVGADKSITTHARIIFATNKDLENAVDSGIFRKDLYYRINGSSVYLPPLRERKDDIERLIQYFFSKHKKKHISDHNINNGAINCLKEYEWPGNIRELENQVQAIISLYDGSTIDKKLVENHMNRYLTHNNNAKSAKININLMKDIKKEKSIAENENIKSFSLEHKILEITDRIISLIEKSEKNTSDNTTVDRLLKILEGLSGRADPVDDIPGGAINKEGIFDKISLLDVQKNILSAIENRLTEISELVIAKITDFKAGIEKIQRQQVDSVNNSNIELNLLDKNITNLTNHINQCMPLIDKSQIDGEKNSVETLNQFSGDISSISSGINELKKNWLDLNKIAKNEQIENKLDAIPENTEAFSTAEVKIKELKEEITALKIEQNLDTDIHTGDREKELEKEINILKAELDISNEKYISRLSGIDHLCGKYMNEGEKNTAEWIRKLEGVDKFEESFPGFIPGRNINEFENYIRFNYLLHFLKKHKWIKKRAARDAGINENSFLQWISKLAAKNILIEDYRAETEFHIFPRFNYSIKFEKILNESQKKYIRILYRFCGGGSKPGIFALIMF